MNIKWTIEVILGVVIVLILVLFYLKKKGILKFGPKKIDLDEIKEQELKDISMKILASLGGEKNIEKIDSCVSRVRVILEDGSLLEEKSLEQLGSKKIIKLTDKKYQIVVGKNAYKIVADILSVLNEGNEK